MKKIMTMLIRFVLLVPVILSALVLAAHFLRSAEMLFMGVCLAIPLLLLVRRGWAAVLVQMLLLAGAFEWVWTLSKLVAMRQSMGMPWTRMAIILGSVAAVTALSALLFETPWLRSRYSRSKTAAPATPAATAS